MVAARAADIVTLQRCRDGKHDIGMSRGGVPPGLMHDHRFGTLPGFDQAVKVLMMVDGLPPAQ